MDALTRYRRDAHDPPVGTWSIATAGGVQALLIMAMALLSTVHHPPPPKPIEVTVITEQPPAPKPTPGQALEQAVPKVLGVRDLPASGRDPLRTGSAPTPLDKPNAPGAAGTGVQADPPSNAPPTEAPPKPAPSSVGASAALPTIDKAPDRVTVSDNGIAAETTPSNAPEMSHPEGETSNGSVGDGEGALAVTVRAFNCPRAIVPPEAIRRRESGRVTVEVLISKTGRVMRSLVTHSSGSTLLDHAAEYALRACRFQPAERATGPVDSVFAASYRFDPPS